MEFSPKSKFDSRTATRTTKPWSDLLLLSLIAGTIFFTNLGGARLWDIDEPRNAGCALEMMERGDWVTPMFNSELRGQKPVLLYWLMMSAYKVFGVNEFSARFWSAVLGMGTVGCTYLMGRHLFGRVAGLWSAIVVSTTMMFTVASRAATPDAPLIFFSTLSLTFYVLLTFKAVEVTQATHSWDRLRIPNRWFPKSGKSLPIYVAMAFGVLAKGPIAAVLPCCVIGLFLMICDAAQERVRSRTSGSQVRIRSLLTSRLQIIDPRRFFAALFRMQPWWLLFTIGVITVPWFIWAGIRTEGDFLEWFFFQEHLGRATTAMENHSGGPWFYPLAILVGFFPWSILAVPVAIGVWREFKQSENSGFRLGLTLALIWVGLQVIVFTLVSTKLPSYVTPCYPAIALVCGSMLARLSQNRLFCNPFWIRGAYVALALVGTGLLIGLPIASEKFELNGGWLGCIGLIPILGATIAMLWSWQGEFQKIPRVLAVCSWAFIFLFFSVGTTVVDQNRQTEQLWKLLPASNQNAPLASYRYLESSWVFYAKRPVWELAPATPIPLPEKETESKVILADFKQAIAIGSTRASRESLIANTGLHPVDPLHRQRFWHPKPKPEPNQLVAAYPDSLILVPGEHLEELLNMLPDNFGEITRCRKFLKQGDLVLVGRLH